MKKTAILTIVMISLVAFTGCQSGLTYETESRTITIKSDPYNARVYQINPVYKHEIFLGLSPIKDQPVNVVKSFGGEINKKTFDFMTTQVGMVNVRIEKEGFMPYLGNLATEKGDTASHRINLEKIR